MSIQHVVSDRVEVKTNLHLRVRERGKLVAQRETHNIWLLTGSQWLARRMGYSSFSPLTQEEPLAVRYMGFGIGGTRQQSLSVVSAPPYSVSYPGSNAQTDTNPSVIRLERPVRVSGGTTPYPGNTGTDLWLKQVMAPPVHPQPGRVTFTAAITELEVSYGPFLGVPLSEIALFIGSNNPLYANTYNNPPIAYDTFEPLTKTSKFTLEADWTLVFY